MGIPQENINFNALHRKEKENSIGDGFIKALGYKCIMCSQEVSPAVVRFFSKWNEKDWHTELLCYECQKLKK